MKIELKNVKYAAFASEETACFRATVYVDGKRAGEAHNDGHGGCTWIEPSELQQRLNDYAKTLPPIETSFVKNGEPWSYAQTGESLIDEALDDWLQRRDMRRTMKGRALIAAPDGTLRETTKMPAGRLRALLESKENQERCVPGGVFLNNLPEDEALALYKRHGRAA